MLSGISIVCFAASYTIALLLEVIGLRKRSTWVRLAVTGASAAGLLAHTLYLVSVAADASATPMSAVEWMLMAAWALAVVYFAGLFYLPRTPTGVVLLPIILALIGGSVFADPQPLAPERSYYLGLFHAIVLLLGTVAVCLGFLAGLMYVVQSYALKHSRSPANGLRLPNLEWLERINSRALGLSAVLIALGFASGLLLSLASHRRDAAYTLWNDPVVWSLAAMLFWLVAAEVFRLVYPAARRGRKVAYLTLASFVFLVIALTSLMLVDTVHGANSIENTDWSLQRPVDRGESNLIQ
ncbi:MAG TPA: cytochrome c biogenesis protein CcsA [Lacipirellulaceae bacterium]|jgi:ABC-type uncharacterized transport system permease subunit|nr:cytochrome c biogenesis protein CcsA [Lacipirellulaceae bacterium]